MKKTYLKPRKLGMILFKICDLFIMNVYDGDGWKKPEIYIRRKQREKIPRLVDFPSPRLRKNGGRLFSVVWRHRKQAGPTLGGTGALI